MNICPLCQFGQPRVFAESEMRFGKRIWLVCPECDLVFVRRDMLPSCEEERREYLLHENSINDAGYVEFLERFIAPLSKFIGPNECGLDYGSGPVPVLAELLNRKGHQVELYDPFFADNSEVFKNKYDFIVSTEVFEHFFNPRQEIDRIVGVLGDQGVLGVMTSIRTEAQSFLDWHYIREQTHVTFFSHRTMEWIASNWGLSILEISQTKAFFRR